MRSGAAAALGDLPRCMRSRLASGHEAGPTAAGNSARVRGNAHDRA